MAVETIPTAPSVTQVRSCETGLCAFGGLTIALRQGAAILIGNIQDTISKIDALSLDKHIPVGTADAGSYFNTEVLEAVEYGVSVAPGWIVRVPKFGFVDVECPSVVRECLGRDGGGMDR